MIWVRNLNAKDNRMLDELRTMTEYKSNARNVMLASYQCLKQRTEIEQLNKKLETLKDTISSMEIEHKSKLDKVLQEYNIYMESVKYFSQNSLQRMYENLSQALADMKQLTVRAKKF